MPMKEHDNILIFYKNKPTYNAQMIERSAEGKSRMNRKFLPNNTGKRDYIGGFVDTKGNNNSNLDKNLRCPRSILKFNTERGLHPTQKPVALLEYLIKTYTNENEIVLDNCMGSGSTGIACINTNRRFIGYELDDKYFEIGKNRLQEQIKNIKVQ
jgi:site-specific DNA-methyltransferase (adenine-specific)